MTKDQLQKISSALACALASLSDFEDQLQHREHAPDDWDGMKAAQRLCRNEWTKLQKPLGRVS